MKSGEEAVSMIIYIVFTLLIAILSLNTGTRGA
jgi:hypothetical protein